MTTVAPYIDEEGKRYLNVHQATALIGGVTERTVWAWAKAEITTFGMELHVKQQPVTKHRYSKGYVPAKTQRHARMVILEADVIALRDIMQTAGREKPTLGWSTAEVDNMQTASRQIRNRKTKLSDLHL